MSSPGAFALDVDEDDNSIAVEEGLAHMEAATSVQRSAPCTSLLDKLEQVEPDADGRRELLVATLRNLRRQQLADGTVGVSDESQTDRARCWAVLAGVPEFQQQYGVASRTAYADLLAHYESNVTSCAEAIEKDVHRTFPRGPWHKLWSTGSSDRTAALTQVLCAYAAWNRRDGYAQGMNFIAGLLLLALGDDQEETVFWILVCVLHRFGLCSIFSTVSPTLQYCLETFSFELEFQNPRLFDHFTAAGIQTWMYGTEWLTTVFSYNLEPDAAFPVFELFLLDGIRSIFSTGLSLLEMFSDELLNWTMEQMLTRFKDRLSEKVSAQRLLRAATRLQLSRQTVASVRQFVVRSGGRGFDLPAPSLIVEKGAGVDEQGSEAGSDRSTDYFPAHHRNQLALSAPLPIASGSGGDHGTRATVGARSVTPPTRRHRTRVGGRTARGAVVPVSRSPDTGGTSPLSLGAGLASFFASPTNNNNSSAIMEVQRLRQRVQELEERLRDAVERDRARSIQLTCMQGALSALKANDPSRFTEGLERAADLSRTSSLASLDGVEAHDMLTSSSGSVPLPGSGGSIRSASFTAGGTAPVDRPSGSSNSSSKRRIIAALQNELVQMERHYLEKISELVHENAQLKALNAELEKLQQSQFHDILSDLEITTSVEKEDVVPSVYRFQPRRERGKTVLPGTGYNDSFADKKGNPTTTRNRSVTEPSLVKPIKGNQL